MSLFDQIEAKHKQQALPLAARMRPRNLDEVCGQSHILAPDSLLRRLLAVNRLGSVLFYGPPGTGKTTVARLLAGESDSRFVQLSAVVSGLKELREALDRARDEVATSGNRTLLFIDEIHRFNKAQQDALLHDVEDGVISLVGATTSNPFFAVNRAIVSRSQVFEFRVLEPADVIDVLNRALRDRQRGLGDLQVEADPQALQLIAERCDGDARRALNTLEIAVLSMTPPIRLSPAAVADAMQQKLIDYDRDGDTHYDTVSALIKSIRGSDVDASIYWLARMLEGGEDIRFLCRRLVILASEDVGNADPQALPLAVATMQACEFVGLPECQLTLSQAVAYLACAPKSNAATVAISEAKRDLAEGRVQPVPKHLRDSHYPGAQELGNGKGYQYAHDHDGGVAPQRYLGTSREYYRPVDRGFEAELRARLRTIRAQLRGDAPAVNSHEGDGAQ